MKPLPIKSLVLIAALLTPPLLAQDAPAKIREIEQKVLLEQYQKALHALVESAREAESGSTPEILDKRLQWLAAVGGQIEEDDKIAAAGGQDMSESAGMLNDLAWSMVTSPDAGARHPEIALKLANIAIELGGEDLILKPKVLDTKARALFLLGKRDEAIAEQEKAVEAATIATEKAELGTTLNAFRRGELPGLPWPAEERVAPATAAAALAAKDLRSRMDEIVDLQRRLEATGSAGNDIKELNEELKKRTDDLAKLTEVKDPANQPGHSAGAAYILGKLRTIVIPSVAFEDTTLEEAVDFLRKQSIELDTTELNPARKGVNIVVRLPVEKPGAASGKGDGKPEAVRIKELRLRNVPLFEALRYVCESTRYRLKVDDHAVTLFSADAPEDFFNRSFSVPPDFGSTLVPIQELLKLCGVKFAEGASATLLPSGTLVVRNTPTEIDKIEQLIEADRHARANRGTRGRSAPAAVAPTPATPRVR